MPALKPGGHWSSEGFRVSSSSNILLRGKHFYFYFDFYILRSLLCTAMAVRSLWPEEKKGKMLDIMQRNPIDSER